MGKNFDNYRIDNKVVTVSLALSAFFLVLMAFRYKNTKTCPPVDFSFRTANKFDVAYEKEKVYFSSEVKYDANEWEWDFGDKTPVDKVSGPYLSHEYAAPGVYTVRLTINGKCEQVKNISIGKRENNKSKLYLRPSWPPETLYAGREYYFGDSTAGAKSWSWYFDRDETKRTKQNVSYQFVEPGAYKVILVINDDLENGKTERNFTVIAPPRLNSPSIPANPGSGGGGGNQRPNINNNPPDDVPTINNATGKSLEQLVSEQSKVPSLGETSLKAYVLDINGNGGVLLRKYLKNGSFSNCSIIFNGKSISIDQLQANIVEHAKNGKTLSAKQEVDGKENYIKVIDINAELERKRGLFGSKGRKYPF
jgi:PKD repeat protein